MIKRKIYLFACCLMICSLAGCAGNGDDEADTPDVHSLADMLMQNVKFEDSVEEVSSETALRYYGIDSVQGSVHVNGSHRRGARSISGVVNGRCPGHTGGYEEKTRLTVADVP